MKVFPHILILIADSTSDSRGIANGKPSDWFLPPVDHLSVRLEFDIERSVGYAKNLNWEGNSLYADLSLADDFSDDTLVPCVGAMVREATLRQLPNNCKTTYEIFAIGLSSQNSDPRIMNLKNQSEATRQEIAKAQFEKRRST